MRWIQRKLFYVIMLVAAVVTPREYKCYLRDLRSEADMYGFFDGYRAGINDVTRELHV
jgi:hypothetical protein